MHFFKKKKRKFFSSFQNFLKQLVTTVSKIYKLFQLKFSERKTYEVQHAHIKMQSLAMRYVPDHQIVGNSKIRENKNRRNVVF